LKRLHIQRVAVAAALSSVALAKTANAQDSTARARSKSAVSAAYSYTGELVGDVAGGNRRGVAFDGAAAVQLSLALERLIAWRGAHVFGFLLGTHGGAPSDFVGDVQGVSNLEAPPKLRLEEFWLQQNLFESHLSLLVGRYDLNTEFYRVQSAALFVNSSFGIGPEFGQSGVDGPSIFPNTTVGMRIDFKQSPNVVWRAAVLRGDLLAGEVAVLSRPDSAGTPRHPRFQIGRGTIRPYARKIAVGAWYYSARLPDIVEVEASGEPVLHRGSRGAYLVADQTVWSASTGARALMAFVQLGIGDERVNQVGSYAGGGLTFAGPLPSRAQDEVGLAIASAMMGSHFKRALLPDNPSSAETTAELTYFAQFGARLAMQPDVQYVIDPGGTNARRNAFVAGLRIALAY
jgi:porin